MSTAEILPLTRAEYDALTDRVNWSTLKHADTSPLHYHHCLAAPDSDSKKLGRAVHTAVLEPEKLSTDYAVWDLGRRAGKDWDAFCASHSGRDILTTDQLLTASTMGVAVRSHPVARKLLAKGKAEQTILWTDPHTRIRCKARLDWLRVGKAVDLKSSRDIEQRAFGRAFGSMLSHGQLGFYNLGLLANGRRVKWRVIAVENTPPFDVAVYNVPDEAVWAGEELAKEALALVARCRKTGRWPGQYPKAVPLELPVWHLPVDPEDAVLRQMEGLL
jgi:hypothetical protein